ALRVLLLDYDLLLTEKGWLLWKRKASPPSSDQELANTQMLETAFDQQVLLSRSNLWCAIDIRETTLGKLRNLLYQPAPIFISFMDDTHKSFTYRILPTTAQSGFILDPLLISNIDIVGFKSDLAGKPKHIVSFRLLAEAASLKYFDGHVSIQLSRIPL